MNYGNNYSVFEATKFEDKLIDYDVKELKHIPFCEATDQRFLPPNKTATHKSIVEWNIKKINLVEHRTI